MISRRAALQAASRIVGHSDPGSTAAVVLAMLARASGAALQLLLSVLLGQRLGSAGLGIFYVFQSWTRVGASIGALGYPILTLRTTAVLSALERRREARRFWGKSLLIAASATVALAFGAYVLRYSLSLLLISDSSLRYVVTFAALSVTPLVCLILNAATLKGQGRPHLALMVEFAAVPAIVIVVLVAFEVTRFAPTPASVLSWYTAAIATTALVSVVLVVRFFSRRKTAETKPRVPPDPSLRYGIKETFRFWVVGLLTQLTANAPILILPLIVSPVSVGLYGAANRLVSLASLILIAIASIYARLFAAAHVTGDAGRLRSLLVSTQLYSVVAYAPALALFILGRHRVLSFFGPEFVAASPILVVLATGQLVNSATGIATYFNLMTSREGVETTLTTAALMLVVVLSIFLGRSHGAFGVAIAVATALAAKNLASYAIAHRTIALTSTAKPS